MFYLIRKKGWQGRFQSDATLPGAGAAVYQQALGYTRYQLSST